jgi:hypothetical protein
MVKPAPLFFVALCERMLCTSTKFARRLWNAMAPSPMVLWQLSLVDSLPADTAVWYSRVRRLGDVLTPAMLMAASLALAPEGPRRDPENIAFENRLLAATDREGKWRW